MCALLEARLNRLSYSTLYFLFQHDLVSCSFIVLTSMLCLTIIERTNLGVMIEAAFCWERQNQKPTKQRFTTSFRVWV